MLARQGPLGRRRAPRRSSGAPPQAPSDLHRVSRTFLRVFVGRATPPRRSPGTATFVTFQFYTVLFLDPVLLQVFKLPFLHLVIFPLFAILFLSMMDQVR